MKKIIPLMLSLIILASGCVYPQVGNQTITTPTEPEFYIACGCGCCSIEDPEIKCLYKSQGDDINKIIADDKLASQNPDCKFAGCSYPVKYVFCEEEKPPEIVKSPSITISKFKGIWTPFLRETRIALNEPLKLQEDGINIVGIGVKICKNHDKFIICEDLDEIKSSISQFHENGFKTALIVNPIHSDFETKFYPPKRTNEILDTLSEVVLEIAALAEEYDAEIFCPLNEPEFHGFGEENISDWAHEILPELRKSFSGKIAFHTQSNTKGYPVYDLSGYDYVFAGGLKATNEIKENPDQTEKQIDNNIEKLKEAYPDHEYIYFGAGAFTGEDYYDWEPVAPKNMIGNSEGWFIDFFVVSEEGQAKFYDLFFPATWKEAEGYFIPVHKGWEYRNKLAEETIQSWFNP
jgi:hypothetical protein